MFTSSTSQRLKNSNERDIFIKSISEAAILRLASEHHGSAPCSFFTPPSRNSHVAWGSFNVCYFIQVGCQDRCVVRIPLRPHLAIDPQAKIEFEIAAMKTVAASTTIPIAKIRAYSSSANKSPDPLSTYMILDFVDGRPLSTVLQDIEAKERPNKLGEIFEPLADILIQLRRLEFPSIGRLYCQSDGIKVHVGPMSIDMNEQELEGHQPLEIQASYYGYNSTLASTKAYTDMLLRLAYNTFANERAEQGTSAKMLYHLHLFSEYAKRWLDPDMENGPFVLFHGDLEPHNILVDPNMSIVAIMDWEWSRVVPAQFFLPPLWLEFSFQHLAIKAVYDIHMRTTFNRFLKTISAREAERYGNQLLTAEWSRHSENGGFLFAHALENFAGPDIDDMVYGYIHSKYYGGTKDLNDRIQAFLAEDDLRAYIIDVKERQSTTDGAIRRQNTSKNVELRSRSDPLFSLALPHSVFALAMGSFLAGVSLFIWKRIH